ncbi:MAG: hypothetical protein ABIJ09_12810 [Pseudomonadota bacterium]
MCATTQQACLISPVDPPIAEPDINHGPVIVDATVLPRPPLGGVIAVSCQDQQIAMDFEVRQVVEYDTDQTLFFNWFIDYTPNSFDINSRPFYEIPIESSGSEVVRDVNQKVRVPVAWLPAQPVGRHVVEVLVADTEPLPGEPAPYRTLPEGGLYDLWYWVIEIVDDGSC